MATLYIVNKPEGTTGECPDAWGIYMYQLLRGLGSLYREGVVRLIGDGVIFLRFPRGHGGSPKTDIYIVRYKIYKYKMGPPDMFVGL